MNIFSTNMRNHFVGNEHFFHNGAAIFTSINTKVILAIDQAPHEGKKGETNKMKLGIIGAGMIVNDFLPSAHLIPGLELDSICGMESDLPVMNSLSRQYDIPHVYTSYEEMLNQKLDLVYVAVPNFLHYSISRMALEHGQNVFVEKPMVAHYREAQKLFSLAEQQGVMIFEAITNQYLTNYQLIRENLAKLGEIRLVRMDYSQYSSRYEKFKEGLVLPAFDPAKAGGALMDLNIYNLHFVTGLFGTPKSYRYYPNLIRGIDVSGVMVMEYAGFLATLTAAKDSCSPSISVIQGDQGYLTLNTPANTCTSFDVVLNGKEPKRVAANAFSHRMTEEFIAVTNIISRNDTVMYRKTRSHSLLVSEIQTKARINAGIRFPNDD